MCMLFSPHHQIAMAFNKKVAAPAVFVLALLLVASCAEAFMCTRPNPFFHGRCVSNLNCASSCIHQNLGTGGHCKRKGLWNKVCVCVYQCKVPSPPEGDDDPPPSGPSPPKKPPALPDAREIQPDF